MMKDLTPVKFKASADFRHGRQQAKAGKVYLVPRWLAETFRAASWGGIAGDAGVTISPKAKPIDWTVPAKRAEFEALERGDRFGRDAAGRRRGPEVIVSTIKPASLN